MFLFWVCPIKRLSDTPRIGGFPDQDCQKWSAKFLIVRPSYQPAAWIQLPIGSMVLVYMLTWLGYIDGIHVTIYSSTMDPMGNWTYLSIRARSCWRRGLLPRMGHRPQALRRSAHVGMPRCEKMFVIVCILYDYYIICTYTTYIHVYKNMVHICLL